MIALETTIPTYLSWSETRDWLPVEAKLIMVAGTDSSTRATYQYPRDGRNLKGFKVYHAPFDGNIGSYHQKLQRHLKHHKQNNLPVTV